MPLGYTHELPGSPMNVYELMNSIEPPPSSSTLRAAYRKVADTFPTATAPLTRVLRHHLTQQARALLLNKDDARGRLARSYFWRASKGFASGLEREHKGIRFFVSTKDQEIGLRTFVFGAFELDIMRQAVALAADILGDDPIRGRTFVDVGANIGTTSLPAAALWGAERVIAVEPDPDNFAILQFNVARNGLASKVSCVRAAATDCPGLVELELSATNPGDHRVRAGSDPVLAAHEAQRKSVTVPGRRLDEILSAEEIDFNAIGLVWIDCQGHEAHVLSSATSLLERATIPFIIEYWPFGLRTNGSLEALHALVETHFQYAWDIRARPEPIRYSSTGLRSLADQYGGETFTDLLLIPRT